MGRCSKTVGNFCTAATAIVSLTLQSAEETRQGTQIRNGPSCVLPFPPADPNRPSCFIQLMLTFLLHRAVELDGNGTRRSLWGLRSPAGAWGRAKVTGSALSFHPFLAVTRLDAGESLDSPPSAKLSQVQVLVVEHQVRQCNCRRRHDFVPARQLDRLVKDGVVCFAEQSSHLFMSFQKRIQ